MNTDAKGERGRGAEDGGGGRELGTPSKHKCERARR